MCTRQAIRQEFAGIDGTEGWNSDAPEVDNKGAVHLINSFSVGGRTRHIDVKQCFLRELKESKQLIVKWIPGTQNNANMFTVKLDGPIFNEYAEMCN